MAKMLHRMGYRVWNSSSDFKKISKCLLKCLPSKTIVNSHGYRRGIFDEGDDELGYYNRQVRKNDNRFNDRGKEDFDNYRGKEDFDNYRGKQDFRMHEKGNSMQYQNPSFYKRDDYRGRSRNSFSQNFGRRRYEMGELPASQFDLQSLPPIEKNFYVEHSDVTNRSLEETENYRETFSVSVSGSDIPNPITKFTELCLPDKLMKIVEEQSYTEPTAIQAQGWPIVLSGRDMIGISQTGSGKTLVFMLPAIVHATNQQHICKPNECRPQVLVMAPTRELVQQIEEVSHKFIQSCGLYAACAYGGASKGYQMRTLRGVNICIATPGRLIDFISEGFVDLRSCSYLVLDEADRMLDMGFEPQIRSIVQQLRPDRQTLMWSATWPKEIQRLAEDFLSDYVKVTIGSGELRANPNIEQNIYIMEEEDKDGRLVSLLSDLIKEDSKVLVFAQTKRKVDSLAFNLNHERIPALSIHGDISQSRRDDVLRKFRIQKSCVLIATDVAARGLDITDVRHVINYDFPQNIEDYIHRIGRTARGISLGVAHSFFTSENIGVAKDLVSVLKQAKQHINPELHSMIEASHKPGRRSHEFQKWNYHRREQAYF